MADPMNGSPWNYSAAGWGLLNSFLCWFCGGIGLVLACTVMKKLFGFTLCLALVLMVGCSSAQVATVESNIHSALLKADQAVTLAEQNPKAVQAVFDAADILAAHSVTLQQVSSDLKGAVADGDLQKAHVLIQKGLLIGAPPPVAPKAPSAP